MSQLGLAWLHSQQIIFIFKGQPGGIKIKNETKKINQFILFSYVTEFRSPCVEREIWMIVSPFSPPPYRHPLSLVLVVAFVVTCTWSTLALLPFSFQHCLKRKRNNGCITFLSRRPAEQALRCTIHFSAAAAVKMLLDLFDLVALFVFF